MFCSPRNQLGEFGELAVLPDNKVFTDDWSLVGGGEGEVMQDGWIRFNSGDVVGNTLLLRCGQWNSKVWLSQANNLFSRLGVTSNFKDYIVVHEVEFRLFVPASASPKGFLFLCPAKDFQTGPSSFKWPDCPAYWSLSPAGERLSAVTATHHGFPAMQLYSEILGRFWDGPVYAGLRQFHLGKEFDPDSQDVAIHFGYPLYQLVSDLDAPPKDQESRVHDGVILCGPGAFVATAATFTKIPPVDITPAALEGT
ncbi:hypothetical protein DFH06DRAFT_616547 [Mycena polygramma]|nr:hypothetical protein DFH06DRAFT_616547 [Mycena polygramma]